MSTWPSTRSRSHQAPGRAEHGLHERESSASPGGSAPGSGARGQAAGRPAVAERGRRLDHPVHPDSAGRGSGPHPRAPARRVRARGRRRRPRRAARRSRARTARRPTTATRRPAKTERSGCCAVCESRPSAVGTARRRAQAAPAACTRTGSRRTRRRPSRCGSLRPTRGGPRSHGPSASEPDDGLVLDVGDMALGEPEPVVDEEVDRDRVLLGERARADLVAVVEDRGAAAWATRGSTHRASTSGTCRRACCGATRTSGRRTPALRRRLRVDVRQSRARTDPRRQQPRHPSMSSSMRFRCVRCPAPSRADGGYGDPPSPASRAASLGQIFHSAHAHTDSST